MSTHHGPPGSKRWLVGNTETMTRHGLSGSRVNSKNQRRPLVTSLKQENGGVRMCVPEEQKSGSESLDRGRPR
jgi:hypothetical protein